MLRLTMAACHGTVAAAVVQFWPAGQITLASRVSPHAHEPLPRSVLVGFPGEWLPVGCRHS